MASKVLERHVDSTKGWNRAGFVGSCLEIKRQSALVFFSDGNNFETGEFGGGLIASFVVRIERARQKIKSPKSASANL